MSSSTSHKKKKRTAVNVKQENAVLAKKCRLEKPKATASPSTHIFTNEVVYSPSRRRRTDSYYKIGTDRLNLSFRSQTSSIDNITNMMAQMSKEINGNFNCTYKRRSTPNRRSGRHSTPIPIPNNQSTVSCSDSDLVGSGDHILSNCLRCYAEDYMTINIGESIIVLIPTSALKEDQSIYGMRCCVVMLKAHPSNLRKIVISGALVL